MALSNAGDVVPDISIQFYALPEELFTIATTAVAEFDLHVVAIRYLPFCAEEIDPSQLAEVFGETSPIREIAFTQKLPDLSAKGRMEFIDKNPCQLSLQIGRLTNQGLEQSWLSSRTDKGEELAVWRKIAGRIKKQTKQGVTAVNRVTGVSAAYKSFRYTEGAKSIETCGEKMVPPQGPNGPTIILGMDEQKP